jgi:hypothetical protein
VIVIEDPVVADEGETLHLRLGDQHPVERITSDIEVVEQFGKRLVSGHRFSDAVRLSKSKRLQPLGPAGCGAAG